MYACTYVYLGIFIYLFQVVKYHEIDAHLS